MKQLTLIRHGQAGNRIVYDQLSALGEQQAAALGRWFHDNGIGFDLVISGGLERQRSTAAAISKNFVVDPRWNEFDLDAVYAGLAGQLADEDAAFREEFADLQRDMADPEHSVHRHWRNCDTTVVRAWISGKYEFGGESHAVFQARIAAGLAGLPHAEHIAVVTSATPIGLCCATALDLSPLRTMHMAAAVVNTGFSEFVMSERTGLRLATFNNSPHLQAAERSAR